MDVTILGAILGVVATIAGAVIWFHTKTDALRDRIEKQRDETAKALFAITERLHAAELTSLTSKQKIEVLERDVSEAKSRLAKEEGDGTAMKIGLAKLETDMIQLVGMIKRMEGKLDTFVDALAMREDERWGGEERRGKKS